MWCAIKSASAPRPTRNSSLRSRKRSPTPGPASPPGRSSVCVTASPVVRRGKRPWRRCLGRAVSPACSPSTGQLISWYGKPARAKTYIYGNAIIAASMLVHDIRAAGRVPLQILIYEAENGEVTLGYDLPSTIMSRFGNKELDAAALELDKKLVAFATELAGAG